MSIIKIWVSYVLVKMTFVVNRGSIFVMSRDTSKSLQWKVLNAILICLLHIEVNMNKKF